VSDGAMTIVLYVLVLILPLRALAARRLPMGDAIKMALAWVAIFGVLLIVVMLWQGATTSA
jgi:aspartyl protease family protein